MFESTKQFVEALEKKNIRYENYRILDEGEREKVDVCYDCECLPFLGITFVFYEDSQSAHIRTLDLVKFPESKMSDMRCHVNMRNRMFRFLKFIINEDQNTINCEADAIFRDHDVAEICMDYADIIVHACEITYPSLMMELWGGQ